MNDAPDRAAVPVALVAPDAGPGLVRGFAALIGRFGCELWTAATLDEFKAVAGRLLPRGVAVVDERAPDAEAVRRWCKADPARAGIRLLTYNQAVGEGGERLHIHPDALLEAGFDPEAAAERVVGWLRDPDGDAAAHAVRFAFPGEPEHLSAAREWLDELLAGSALPRRERDRFGIGVMEAVDNFRHETVAGRVLVAYTADERAVAVDITVEPLPDGPGFEPDAGFEPWEADPAATTRARVKAGGRGGLGLILLHRCADRVRYDPARHAVTLWKYPEPAAEGGR